MTYKIGAVVLGNDARGHALAEALSCSERISHVLSVPGNGGIEQQLRRWLNIMDFDAVLKMAREEHVQLIVPSGEQTIVAGIADHFLKHAPDINVFAPFMLAARLEGSKAFCKSICSAMGIRTPEYRIVYTAMHARKVIQDWGVPIVIKADGLCSGKGVVVAETAEEAYAAVHDALVGNKFGPAGHTLVIERFIPGREVSVMAFCGSNWIIPMLPARDYKRAYNGNRGLNTGGMGACCPVPYVNAQMMERIKTEILYRLKDAMTFEGTPYRGILYAGIMIDEDGNPYLLEVNCRGGGPEMEVVLPLLQSDLAEIMLACLETPQSDEASRIPTIQWGEGAAVGVVMTTEEYPEPSQNRGLIYGLPAASQYTRIYHAGTAENAGKLSVDGGRILTVVGEGKDITEARQRAYAGVYEIDFGGRYRIDIAENL